MNLCGFSECSNKVLSRGLCSKHYVSEKRAGTLSNWGLRPKKKWVDANGLPVKCAGPCENPASVKGYCHTHYQQNLRGAELTEIGLMLPCPISWCERKRAPKGEFCKVCNQLRWRYSLTRDETLHILESKPLGCANPGCDSKDTNLHLDHDHACCPPGGFEKRTRVSCGRCVRGWLCHGCNTALGHLQENPRRIEGLLALLKGFKP